MSKNTNPTLLDYAILGLIQNTAMTGYRIRKAFEETALGNYSSSPGTIYPALKRMEKLQLVRKVALDNSKKALFEISPSGIASLKAWLTRPVTKEDAEKKVDELLLRFAFMETLAAPEQKIHFLTSFKDKLVIYTRELAHYLDQESEKMPLHGRLAVEHGIASKKATIKWCTKVMSELKQHKK